MIASTVHPIHQVHSVELLVEYTLRVTFEDGSIQQIDFSPVLEGEMYGPLRDPSPFRQVRIDPDAHTLVWPNGADFDPATLHDWPVHESAFRQMAARWKSA